MERHRVLVAIDTNESFSDVTKRILSKFITLWGYPIEDVNFGDFILTLFQEDGCQHIDSSTLRHNELIVFKMETFDNRLLQRIGFFEARPQQPISTSTRTNPIESNPIVNTVPNASSGDPLLDQLREFIDGSGFVLTEEAILLIRQQGDTLEVLSNFLFSNLDDLQSPKPDSRPLPTALGAREPQIMPPPPPDFVIPPEVCTRECKICMETFPMEDMYILICNQSHAFCISCLSQQIHITITPSSDSAGVIPACSCANGEGGCRYTLTLQEIEQILQLAVDQDLISAVSRRDDLKRVKKMFFVSLSKLLRMQSCKS